MNNMNEGWIKLHRRFLEWEWFDSSDMIKLFIYILLKVNHKENTWRGIKIGRGQFLTGLNTLSKETKISIQSLRTCLKRLESTKEINMQVTNKYRIITACNYDSYQDVQQATNKQPNKQLTGNQQAGNKQPTTNKNEENDNNEKNDKKIEFETFWNLYNKKVGKKSKIKTKWDKLTIEVQEKILDYIPKYIESQPDKKFRKNPETFFNNEGWNDEIIDKEEPKKPGNSADETYKFE